MSDGSIPTLSIFLSRLRLFVRDDVAGQSLRAAGATDLALSGTPPSLIHASGRWTSESFRIYVRKSPILIHALLHQLTVLFQALKKTQREKKLYL